MIERGDNRAARAALEEAVVAAPTAFGLALRLATLEEAEGLHDAAIARYQRIVESQPTNVIALNNLAYALAVRRHTPAEALPLAKRAVALAPRSSSVLDTLAWVEHLIGNHAVAAKVLNDAVKLDPGNAELRLHAAAVAAALGDRSRAESDLKEALRLDGTLNEREETRQLRERIAALPVAKPI
jgi:cellulose synthase operon protein C